MMNYNLPNIQWFIVYVNPLYSKRSVLRIPASLEWGSFRRGRRWRVVLLRLEIKERIFCIYGTNWWTILGRSSRQSLETVGHAVRRDVRGADKPCMDGRHVLVDLNHFWLYNIDCSDWALVCLARTFSNMTRSVSCLLLRVVLVGHTNGKVTLHLTGLSVTHLS
jgi:hypothetical protein